MGTMSRVCCCITVLHGMGVVKKHEGPNWKVTLKFAGVFPSFSDPRPFKKKIMFLL